MAKCRFFNTRICSLWLASVHDASESSTVAYSEQFFKLQIFAQALDQATNLVDTDHTLNAMRLIKDFCERGGVLACRAFVSVQGHDIMCTALKPSLLTLTSCKNASLRVKLPCHSMFNIGNFAPQPPKKETVELFEMFFYVLLVLCCCQEKLDGPDVNEAADPDQTGEGPEGSSKVAEDLILVIIDSPCAEKVHEVLLCAPMVDSIRTLGRRLFNVFMTAGVTPQVLECQEMWSGVAVTCLCSAVSFGDGEEVSNACENLLLCAKDGNSEQWCDTILTRYATVTVLRAL